MRSVPESLLLLVRRVVEGMGYELVGVEYLARPRSGRLLRVYIDVREGVTVDDCSAVSRQLGGVLDVEDPIRQSYDLEVSSPGSDRPLFYPEQFVRFIGHEVRVRLATKMAGRGKFTGILRGFDGGAVIIEENGEPWRLPLEQIERACLVPKL
jgi:ribosome maturation factor RimP